MFQQKGELEESWFNQHGIPDDGSRWERKEKDERAPHRRRAVMFTHSIFQERLKEQEREKDIKEKERKGKQEKREKGKEKREKRAQTAEKRKLALQLGAKRKHANEVNCLVCIASYHAYQDNGLEEKIEDGFCGENVWAQCDFCEQWFCPEHTALLTGRTGHEAVCKTRKTQRIS